MLHSQARELLDNIERSGAAPIYRLPPSEARRVYRDRRFATQPEPPAVGSPEDLTAHQDGLSIRLRLYRPHKTPRTTILPALVFFHGGGFVIGDLDMEWSLFHEQTQTNLLERPFVEERRRLKIVPNGFGEKPVLKLMFGALIRAAERWRGLRFTEFELRQIAAVRKELDNEYQTSITPLVRSSQTRASRKSGH